MAEQGERGANRQNLTFEHRMVQILQKALETGTTVHLYGSGFHLIGVITLANERFVEMRMGDKTILVRFERIDALST
ncbi:MAG: hypothetical protein EB084_09430 [Proteobacteria bacterium]|nr:hypothetical protein [Pseudomonadota bacterium]